jgi:ferredoxin
VSQPEPIALPTRTTYTLPHAQLDRLIGVFEHRGFTVIGPVARDGAVALDVVHSAAELPSGGHDLTAPGSYRFEPDPSAGVFDHAGAAQSWKRWLHPPQLELWRVRAPDGELEFDLADAAPRYALLGVRSCELRALELLDRVLLDGPVCDPVYAARRRRALIVAVSCRRPAATCFCVSMGAGPAPERGFDLLLDELIEPARRFLLRSGSDAGDALARELELAPAAAADLAQARAQTTAAAARMGRALDTTDLARRLAERLDHPRWTELGRRCLGCANCTQVCPTCFCTSVTDATTLDGELARRERRWDSCFTLEFSYLHGGSVRRSSAARYRQFLSHKLMSWPAQFGGFGCVGCGRCITWCPAGIDLTVEAAAIAGVAASAQGAPS